MVFSWLEEANYKIHILNTLKIYNSYISGVKGAVSKPHAVKKVLLCHTCDSAARLANFHSALPIHSMTSTCSWRLCLQRGAGRGWRAGLGCVGCVCSRSTMLSMLSFQVRGCGLLRGTLQAWLLSCEVGAAPCEQRHPWNPSANRELWPWSSPGGSSGGREHPLFRAGVFVPPWFKQREQHILQVGAGLSHCEMGSHWWANLHFPDSHPLISLLALNLSPPHPSPFLLYGAGSPSSWHWELFSCFKSQFENVKVQVLERGAWVLKARMFFLIRVMPSSSEKPLCFYSSSVLVPKPLTWSD